MVIVGSNAIVYVFELVKPGLVPYLTLFPPALYAGEFWRLLTFLFVPPAMNPIFLFFWLYLIYVYAQALEHEWGSFRFTVYYLVGALATAAAGFYPGFSPVSNMFLNASLFLAFATLFPDFELMLFFILPVKVKYVGYFTWFMLVWTFVTSGAQTRLAVAAGLANYFLLLGPDLWGRAKLRWQVHRNRRKWR
jgi:membrane associated rhomboid family serine protease